jgi:hypothetical protein
MKWSNWSETADEAVMKTCFACHEKAKVSDLTFSKEFSDDGANAMNCRWQR